MKRGVSVLAFAVALGVGACSWIAGIEEIHMVADDGGASTPLDGGGPGDTDTGVASDAAGDALGSDVFVVADAGADARPPAPDASQCNAGTTLFQGECYPKVIASGLAQPIALAVVGGSVVWAENAQGVVGGGAVRSCPVTGCAGAPTDLFVNLTRPRIRSAGGGGVPVVYDSAAAIGIQEITSGTAATKILDATNVLAATASTTFAVWLSDAVYYCPRSACTAKPLALPTARTVDKSGPVSLDGDRLYAALANGGIGTCTLPNCADFVASGTDTMPAMINDGVGAVYVPTSGTELMIFRSLGPSVQPGATLPPAAVNVSAIAADGSNAFLATSNGVYGGPTASGQTSTQRSSAPARDVAIDATFVYWVEPGMGRVMVAPR